MSDETPLEPTAPAAEPLAAPSSNHRETAEDLATLVLRDVTLTLRAVEEIDTRLGAIEIELMLLIGLSLLAVAVTVALKGKGTPAP